jgi:hypothetical protein
MRVSGALTLSEAHDGYGQSLPAAVTVPQCLPAVAPNRKALRLFEPLAPSLVVTQIHAAKQRP